MTAQPAQRERTFAITILAILAAIAGILSLLDVARYMGWLPIATFGELSFVLPQAQWFAAIMAAIVAVIYFVVAYWLWTLNPSGWLFVVIISIFNLIFLFLAILGATSFGDVMWQIILNALILILAILPSTKEAFLPPRPSPDAVKEAADQAAAVKAAATAAATETAADTQAGASVAAATAATAAANAEADASDAAAATRTAATEAVQADIEPQDLTQVEGIGPKIAGALQAAGINSYEELANMPPEQLRQILADAGLSADPSTWPDQASLAASGQWDDLKALQDRLQGGRKT